MFKHNKFARIYVVKINVLSYQYFKIIPIITFRLSYCFAILPSELFRRAQKRGFGHLTGLTHFVRHNPPYLVVRIKRRYDLDLRQALQPLLTIRKILFCSLASWNIPSLRADYLRAYSYDLTLQSQFSKQSYSQPMCLRA